MALKMTIGKRLGLGFSTLALLGLLLGILAIYGVSALSASLENMGGNRVPALLALAELNKERMAIRAQTQAAFAYETQENIAQGLQRIQTERAASWQKVDKSWEQLLKIPRTSERGQRLQEQLQGVYQNWRSSYRQLDAQIAQLVSASTPAEITALYAAYRQAVRQMVPISDQMGQIFDDMTENNVTRTQGMMVEGAALSKELSFWAVVSTVTSLVLAALLGVMLTRSVTIPLRQGGNILSSIAGGDMTRAVPTILHTRADEIGDLARAMRDMVGELCNMVVQVTETTAQVSAAAGEIAQGSMDLSQRTEEQASALEQTAASMQQLTSAVKQSADHAGQANQLASSARDQAERGANVVAEAVSAMSGINQSSRKIADIISVIDEIAFQTNLLALNAAVEAARAGQEGLGFAVVASEVQKLAQRSADAAKEIKVLIIESVDKVEDGTQLVDRTGHTLREIMAAIKKVSDIVAEMAAAAREQAVGIEQVNRAIMQMDQVTQQNAALVEETAAASKSMDDQAQQLQALMAFFKVDR